MSFAKKEFVVSEQPPKPSGSIPSAPVVARKPAPPVEQRPSQVAARPTTMAPTTKAEPVPRVAKTTQTIQASKAGPAAAQKRPATEGALEHTTSADLDQFLLAMSNSMSKQNPAAAAPARVQTTVFQKGGVTFQFFF